MSAIARFETESLEASRTCQILILCEDGAAYERATNVCWRILVQLADDLDFKFNYWNFYEMSDPGCAPAILRSAKWSDVILLSLHEANLPIAAEDCLEAIANNRLRAEGVLALVLSEPPGSPEALTKLVARLERTAQGMGMDFLSLVKNPVKEHEPLAAGFSGSDGDRCLDHWGLNE